MLHLALRVWSRHGKITYFVYEYGTLIIICKVNEYGTFVMVLEACICCISYMYLRTVVGKPLHLALLVWSRHGKITYFVYEYGTYHYTGSVPGLREQHFGFSLVMRQSVNSVELHSYTHHSQWIQLVNKQRVSSSAVFVIIIKILIIVVVSIIIIIAVIISSSSKSYLLHMLSL